jgi:hypothetical protein
MAWENKVIDISLEADEDLSNDQYRIVVLDATTGKVRRPDATTDIPLGILQNAPDAKGKAAVIRPIGCGGISKIQLGATLSTGAIIGIEYVSATDAGKAKAIAAKQYPVGVLLAGGAEDELGVVLLAQLTFPTVQQSHIADPTGGTTVDAEARTAINAIFVALETHGLLATS